MKGHTGAAHKFLTAKADTAVATAVGFTPLHLTAVNGHAKAVQAFLAAKADSAAASADGPTPLHLAAVNGHTEAVQALLAAKGAGRRRWVPPAAPGRVERERGGGAGVPGGQGGHRGGHRRRFTPLPLAAVNGHTEAAQAHLAATTDPEGATADRLHAAASGRCERAHGDGAGAPGRPGGFRGSHRRWAPRRYTWPR